MKNNTEDRLTSISTFEEFEKLKLNSEIFEDFALQILTHHKLPIKPLRLFSEGTNIVFSYDGHLVVKLFPPFHQDQFESERLVLKALEGKLSVKTSTIVYEGGTTGWFYIIMTELKGALLENIWPNLNYENKLIIIEKIGLLIKEVHSLPIDGLESIDCNWRSFIQNQIKNCAQHHRSKGLSASLLEQLLPYIEIVRNSLLKIDKPVLLIGEYTPMNFLVNEIEGTWHISGLIDFGDAMLGSYQYDLLGPVAFLIQGNKELLNAFLGAYGYLPSEINRSVSHQLMALMLLHKYSNFDIQIRIDDWKLKVSSLRELEHLVFCL